MNTILLRFKDTGTLILLLMISLLVIPSHKSFGSEWLSRKYKDLKAKISGPNASNKASMRISSPVLDAPSRMKAEELMSKNRAQALKNAQALEKSKRESELSHKKSISGPNEAAAETIPVIVKKSSIQSDQTISSSELSKKIDLAQTSNKSLSKYIDSLEKEVRQIRNKSFDSNNPNYADELSKNSDVVRSKIDQLDKALEKATALQKNTESLRDIASKNSIGRDAKISSAEFDEINRENAKAVSAVKSLESSKKELIEQKQFLDKELKREISQKNKEELVERQELELLIEERQRELKDLQERKDRLIELSKELTDLQKERDLTRDAQKSVEDVEKRIKDKTIEREKVEREVETKTRRIEERKLERERIERERRK